MQVRSDMIGYYNMDRLCQRCTSRGRPWPRGLLRGHILKCLALASTVKSLALKPQVLENCPVLGSRTALFFKLLKFCWKTPEVMRIICKNLSCLTFLEDCLKKLFEDFFGDRLKSFSGNLFFGEHLRLCTWSWSWPRALCPRLHVCSK